MRHRGRAVLVDQRAGGEALEREGLRERMRFAFGERPGEDVARAGRGLEAARAPAAIDVQVLDREGTDNRRSVGTLLPGRLRVC